MSDPDAPTETREERTRRKYLEWDTAHAKLQGPRPKEPHVYLKHARNLIPLLEGVSELHPVAKGVVFTFKALVLYQCDWVENDNKLAAVYLSQTHMMRVVLQIGIIAENNSDDSIIESNLDLQERLQLIQNDIESFTNACDTYRKEKRVVRVLKSQEWKARLIEYNDNFLDHRNALMTLLSIRTASGVDRLREMMHILIAKVFTPQSTWESKLVQQWATYGDYTKWLNDPAKLQKMLELSEDPSVDPDFLPSGSDTIITEFRLTQYLKSLREEIQTSLEELCFRNLDTFKLKLDLQKEQIQESINAAQRAILGELSGPHDRLGHKDLKTIWKEMKWIFYVDSDHFTMAIYEYYRDILVPTVTDSEEIEHEDRWTIEYLTKYKDRLHQALDQDSSGFVRISEINDFMKEIPAGWTFLQWCAFHVIGYQHERLIYQKQIHHLLDVFYEAQVQVSPRNKDHLLQLGEKFGIILNLSRGPETFRSYDSLPLDFLDKIEEKIKLQDDQWRNRLTPYIDDLDSEQTIRMVFNKRPIDTYILQFCMFIMEHFVSIAQRAHEDTVDAETWARLERTVESLRQLANKRIRELEVTFKEQNLPEVDERLSGFWDGMYRVCLNEDYRRETVQPWGDVEVEYRLGFFHLLEDIPFAPQLRDRTLSEETAYEHPHHATAALGPSDFPASLFCNNCTELIVDMPRYRCIDCPDYDLCVKCFGTPPNAPEDTMDGDLHKPDHVFLKLHLRIPNAYTRWLEAWATNVRSKSWMTLLDGNLIGMPSGSDGSMFGGWNAVACKRCKKKFTSSSGHLYKCLHRLCIDKDFHLCPKCEARRYPSHLHTESDYFPWRGKTVRLVKFSGAAEEEEAEEVKWIESKDANHHRSWHTLVAFPMESFQEPKERASPVSNASPKATQSRTSTTEDRSLGQNNQSKPVSTSSPKPQVEGGQGPVYGKRVKQGRPGGQGGQFKPDSWDVASRGRRAKFGRKTRSDQSTKQADPIEQGESGQGEHLDFSGGDPDGRANSGPGDSGSNSDGDPHDTGTTWQEDLGSDGGDLDNPAGDSGSDGGRELDDPESDGEGDSDAVNYEQEDLDTDGGDSDDPAGQGDSGSDGGGDSDDPGQEESGSDGGGDSDDPEHGDSGSDGGGDSDDPGQGESGSDGGDSDY